MDSLPLGSLENLEAAGSAGGGDVIDCRILNLLKQPFSDSHREVEVFSLHSERPY